MTIEGQSREEELKEIQNRLDAAKKSSTDRGERVDDLRDRFRELRRRNHFRMMLEEIFTE